MAGTCEECTYSFLPVLPFAIMNHHMSLLWGQIMLQSVIWHKVTVILGFFSILYLNPKMYFCFQLVDEFGRCYPIRAIYDATVNVICHYDLDSLVRSHKLNPFSCLHLTVCGPWFHFWILVKNQCDSPYLSSTGGGGYSYVNAYRDVSPKWVTFSPKILRHGSHFGQKNP